MKFQQGKKAAAAASVLLGVTHASTGCSNKELFRVEGEYTHLLPFPFSGNLTLGFTDGTDVSNDTVMSSLSVAQDAAFISYDDEFDQLIGSASLNTVVANTSLPYTWAGEAGIWVPDLNQVWMTSTLYGGKSTIYILDLENNTVIEPTFSAADGFGSFLPLANPAGGYYFNGTVYACIVGNEDYPSGVVAIDPRTLEATPVVNSYFGLELPPVDDVVVSYTTTSDGFQRHLVSYEYPRSPNNHDNSLSNRTVKRSTSQHWISMPDSILV